MKSLVAGLIILLCTGCYQHEASEILEEKVVIRDLVFTPSQHGSSIGVDLDLNLTFSDITIQEKYTIVFECLHGSFIVERPDLWKVLREDSTYTVCYKEIYSVDGTNKVLINYDCIGLKEFPNMWEDKYRDFWKEFEENHTKCAIR